MRLIAGLRRSDSISRTRLPAWAKDNARLSAVVVAPSPGMVAQPAHRESRGLEEQPEHQADEQPSARADRAEPSVGGRVERQAGRTGRRDDLNLATDPAVLRHRVDELIGEIHSESLVNFDLV